MKLLGIELNGIAVSLGITLIVCGAVVYYCQNRIKNIEMALMKQNQVLSSFIANVQNEIKNGTMNNNAGAGGHGGSYGGNSHAKLIVDNNELASEEARLAVSQLIEVSDDEESDDESESDNESESHDESDCESGDEDNTKQDDSNSIRVIDLGNLNQNNQNKTKHVEELSPYHEQENVKIIELIGDVGGLVRNDASSESSSDEEEEEDDDEDLVENNVSSVQIVEETLLEISNLNITNTTEEHNNNNNNNNNNIDIDTLETLIDEDLTNDNFFIKKIVTNFSKAAEGALETSAEDLEKMKVDELRDLALSKGLSTKNEVKKFKKVELLHLLQK